MGTLKVDTIQDSGGNTILSSDGSGGFSNSLPAGKTSSFRNLIINGDMSIAQRGTSVSSYGSVAYSTVDRFKTVFEVGTYTVSQESLSSGEAYNNGFRKAFKALVTSTASPPSAGSQTTFEQRIEGQMCQALKKGTSNAESLTLSFWVRSSKTGSNLQVNLIDNDNTRQVGGTYNISSTDTWEKKTITFPPDTTGALDNDNGNSLTLEWFLDGGSNYSGGAVPTTWEASSNADRNVTNFDLAGDTDDWWITGVQLEVGTTASDFEFLPHDVNLQRCERYCQTVSKRDSNENHICLGVQYNASNLYMSYEYRTVMRGAPSLTAFSGTSAYRFYRNGSYDQFNSFTIDSPNEYNCSFYNNGQISGTAGQAGFVRWDDTGSSSGNSIILDAEL